MQDGKNRSRARVAVLPSAGDRTARMRLGVVVILLASAASLVRPVAACAGWPLEAAARVTLAFGDVYLTSGGDGSRHRGVDLEAVAGARIVAPLPGRVSFVGSVPGVGGGRVTAVTLETARGRVTLLPIEAASVSRGDEVREGADIGAVAVGGDGSTQSTHLHVGAREGDLYLDPLVLMSPPAPGMKSSPDPDPVAGAQAAVTISDGVDLAQACAAPEGAGAGAGITSPAGGEIAPGVSVAVRGSANVGATAGSSVPTVKARGRQAPTDLATPLRTVLTADGVVVAAGTEAVPQRSPSSAWLSSLVPRARALAERSLRVAGLALLGMLAALGALWPLWRGEGGKGARKVLVRALEEDVAAAPGR